MISLIKEVSLEESEHFNHYEYSTYLYEKGIKADTCIIVDGLETYCNKLEEVVYIESFEFFKEYNRDVERSGEISGDI